MDLVRFCGACAITVYRIRILSILPNFDAMRDRTFLSTAPEQSCNKISTSTIESSECGSLHLSQVLGLASALIRVELGHVRHGKHQFWVRCCL